MRIGSGVGFGYATTTPASLKWFPPERAGLIAGIVVAGFDLAPVVLAPPSAWLLDAFATTTAAGAVEKGVPATMIVLSVEGAVATLAGMTRLDDFRRTAVSRKAFEDPLLGSEVWSALTVDECTRSAHVRVAADDGAVLITGSAGNERVLRPIVEIAERVPGVIGVQSGAGVGGQWQW